MNRDQAYALIRQTFSQGYDRTRYHNFVINLLNHVDESKAQSWKGPYIKNAFKDYVKHYERIGTYTAPDNQKLDVLTVHLSNETTLERARTAIRNFVADHLKTRDEKAAALVAFVSPTEMLWRFSYIKMEYEAVQKTSGKVGVEEHLTPARRFSYIVGEGESCHTAQTRFLSLLQETKTDPKLSEIEDAFSVEAVTKEFFKLYATLFEEIHQSLETLIVKDKQIHGEFEAKQVNAIDFAKKLMGQIVFLYFLQKKGWLGVEKGQPWGAGPRDFLRRLAKGLYGRYDNYFNDMLEPLFYDTLATDRGHDAWCENLKCRIPFLNGGLFEPLSGYNWRTTNILLPNYLFTNDRFVEEGITGTGVLDVFDRYNFTVNEAEPLEKEVAIDPEMLGKVFENLIEENRRKGLGSYYTPREIVHYMCQESLISYLDVSLNTTSETLTTERPKQGRLLGQPDPEQVSLRIPAFKEIIPRADIETFVHLGEQISHYESVDTRYSIKMPKSIEKYSRLIDTKLADITVCDPAVGSGAFPVGIMTEIVHSRLALNPYFKEVRGRTPYHFKQHAIKNCLYGVDIDAGAVEIAKLRLWLSLVVDEEDVNQIKPLPNLDYKIVAGNSLLGFPFKSQRLTAIESLKLQFFDETNHENKMELKSKIDHQLNEAFAASKRSLGYEVNFDFEIYFSEVFQGKGGFDVIIANPPYVDSETMVRLDPHGRALLARAYETARGNWDLYIPFWELALKKISPTGTATLITPNKWLSIGYGKMLREYAAAHVRQIVDYSKFRAFENVGVFPIVVLMSKGNQRDLKVRRYKENQRLIFEYEMPSTYLKIFENWGVFLSQHLSLISKLVSSGAKLSTYCDPGEPFTVSEAYKLTEYIEEWSSVKGEILRFVNTGTIDPYVSLWGHKQTTYIKKKYFKPVINGTKLKRDFPRRYAQSRSPKILISGIRHFESFWDKEGSFVAGKSTVILSGFRNDMSPEFLLGVLNSRLVKLFLKECYGSLAMDGGINFSPANVSEIPISEPNIKLKSAVVALVDKILYAKARDIETSTIAYESEIDRLVYELYNLTEEEIAIVEDTIRE